MVRFVMALKKIAPEFPEFYTPINPQSMVELSIPERYLTRYLHGLDVKDSEGRLIDDKGEEWPVKVKDGRIKEGWVDFLRAHELVLCEYVLFKHHGNLIFEVLILGRSACDGPTTQKKHYDVLQSSTSVEHTGKEIIDVNDVLVTDVREKWVKTSQLYVYKGFTTAHGLQKMNGAKVSITDAEGHIWEMKLLVFKKADDEKKKREGKKKKRERDEVYIRGVWRQVQETIDLEEGDYISLMLTGTDQEGCVHFKFV